MSMSQDPESGVTPMLPHGNQPLSAFQGSCRSADAVPSSYSNTDQAEPPPSYYSLFGQVHAAKEELSSTSEFFKKLFFYVFSRVGCTIILALMLAVPISMVVIGSIYLGQCPQKHYIPIYLIVTGAFGILKILLNIGQCVKAPVDEEGDDENVTRLNQYGDVLSSVLVSCFIAGNVLIYCIYNDFDSLDATSPKYCQPTLYWFAFWMTNVANILILSLCCCCSCRAVIVWFTSNSSK